MWVYQASVSYIPHRYTALHAWLLVYPKDLCCDWAGGSIGLVESYSDLRIWGIVTLYCAIAALIYEGLFASTHRRWRAELLVGLALLVVPFVPATGLFMEVGFVLAERILYIPSMGFCLLVAGAVNRVSFPTGFRWQSQAGAVMIFVLFLYSARTVVRNQDWLDEVSLFGSGVRVAPNNAKLHHNYAYYSEDRVKEFHLREAIRLYPPYVLFGATIRPALMYLRLQIYFGVHKSRSAVVSIWTIQ